MSSKKSSPKSRTKLTKAEQLALLDQASEAAELEMIRARLALPIHKRTNFLRVRVADAPNQGTAL